MVMSVCCNDKGFSCFGFGRENVYFDCSNGGIAFDSVGFDDMKSAVCVICGNDRRAALFKHISEIKS